MMAEYIRREGALEAFDEWIETTGAIPKGTSYYHECRGCIEDAPAADVAPVMHGKWDGEKDHGDFREVKCTACGGILLVKWSTRLSEYNYCPNCGADMRGGSDE